jgi:hypothetical protein
MQGHVQCPSCGGAGGGPFGPAGTAWDDDSYVCPRCEGRGWVTAEELAAPAQPRPGIAKAARAEGEAAATPAKKKASA